MIKITKETDLRQLTRAELRAVLAAIKGIELPDDPIPRCGYFFLSTDWIYRLFGKEDPFLDCCLIHDIEYELKRKARNIVDNEFYLCCLAKAKGSKLLGVGAHFNFMFVRLFGVLVW